MARDELLGPLAEKTWHVAVIGAGPAGCVAAAMLADRGRRVLLIEKSTWPREKVCGGCLNHSAIQTIRAAGFDRALAGGRSLDRVEWHCGRRQIAVPMPGGIAMLRSDLDAALAAEAESRGCTFMTGVSASLVPGGDSSRAILLRQGARTQTVTAEVVLACDGIGGSSVESEPWARWKIAGRGWIGVAATLSEKEFPTPPAAGAICMHIGVGGYVGLVRLPDGGVHLAAALDPRRCRAAGGPGRMIETILAATGIVAGSALEAARLRGTGVMTRRRRGLGGHRVLAVGDACGYVEPFTGEGMAWAVRSAALAAALLPGPGEDWPAELPANWESVHAVMIRRRQRWCRSARPIVHCPPLASALIALGSLLPWMSRELASRVCGAYARTGEQWIVEQ